MVSTLAAAGIAVALLAGACGASDDDSASTQPEETVGAGTASSGDRPDATATDGLTIGELPESLAPLASSFTKYVDVWGVNVVATANTGDDKVLHAANVMLQYLDNDADGSPDNPAVVESMVANNATLLMGATPDEFESIDQDAVFGFVGAGGQDLYGSETAPVDGFDASLEEVHHLILNTGWAIVHPEQLGQAKGSGIADAMDLARGGQFDTVPSPYPDGAWYTYDDRTCDYTCMITEYTYWAHTSLLGAQADRAGEISHEWSLARPDDVRSTDPGATAILEDPALGLPTVIPDGNYQAVVGS